MDTWYRNAHLTIENKYSDEQEQKIAKIIRLATIKINENKAIPENKKLRILAWYASNSIYGKWMPDSQEKLLKHIAQKSKKEIILIPGEEILTTAKTLQNKWIEFNRDGVITSYAKQFKIELDNTRVIMKQREMDGKRYYYNPFSNFEPFTKPVKIEGEGNYFYPENLYQSAKTENKELREQFTGIDILPGKAKTMGRKLELRSNWKNIKINVMSWIQKKRLEGHDDKLQKWLDTSPLLIIEWNNWGDKAWGIDIQSGEGLNLMGVILMLYRDRIRGEDKIGGWMKE